MKEGRVANSPGTELDVIFKRILRKHGYLPDKQERATQTVPEHAKVLSEGWLA